MIALPMLLYSSDVKGWIRDSPKTFIAYGLCLIAGILSSGTVSFFFQDYISDIHIPAGMIVGIYSGGTPNLFAVGVALEAQDEVFTLLNSSVVFWGGIYLLFLMSLGRLIIGYVLPRYKHPSEDSTTANNSYLDYKSMSIRESLLALGITILIVGFSIGVSLLLFKKLEPTLIIVFVTTIAILLSLSKSIRKLRGPFEIGDYMLLMFGVAVGMISDFKVLIMEGGPFILFVICVLLGTIILHLLLCKFFHIDRDTFIITSAAGIFGPVFITQIASALRNRSVIIGGMAVALIGLALGNYIGIGLGYFLKWIL